MTNDPFSEQMPPHPATAAQCVAWAMSLPGHALYRDLLGHEREVREAWLTTIAARPLTDDRCIEVERFLRRMMVRLGRHGRAYTVTYRDVVYYAKFVSDTLSATHHAVRKPRPKPLSVQLAVLLQDATGQVHKCPECLTWFSRKTTRRRFCGTRCANRHRTRALRRRQGKHPVKHITAPPQEYARDAIHWPVRAPTSRGGAVRRAVRRQMVARGGLGTSRPAA